MKKVRRDRERWQPPTPLPAVAVFACRRCQAALTKPLTLLTDATDLREQYDTSRVPPGHYWPVAAGQDFAGTFAVADTDMVAVRYHPDTGRLLGCCGPSGSFGRNRICTCGYEIGTERSDCVWPRAVYLDPTQVRATANDNKVSAEVDGVE